MNGNPMIQQAYQSILEHDFEGAIEWFQQAIRAEPRNAEFRYKLSITFARSNKLAEAIKHAKEAVRLQPEHFVFLYHYRNLRARELVQEAGCRMEQGFGDLTRVVEMLKQAIHLDSLYLEAYIMLAVAYTGLRRYALATETLEEALRLDPQREEAQLLLQQLESNEHTMNR